MALLCVTACAASAQRPAAPESYDRPAADTLRYAVRAGETLIVALPARVAGAEARYQVDQAPSLSWLVDRSFMWQTLAQERGTLPVRLLRRQGTRPPEPVVLLVEITP